METEITRKHILTLIDLGFIALDPRQKDLLNAFSNKYKQKGMPGIIHQEMVKDAKLMILFS